MSVNSSLVMVVAALKRKIAGTRNQAVGRMRGSPPRLKMKAAERWLFSSRNACSHEPSAISASTRAYFDTGYCSPASYAALLLAAQNTMAAVVSTQPEMNELAYLALKKTAPKPIVASAATEVAPLVWTEIAGSYTNPTLKERLAVAAV
jgi:hypothetical protein